MKLGEFLKDKIVFLAVNFLVFIFIAVFVFFSTDSLLTIFLIGCIWFIPLILYTSLDFIKWNRYFKNIYGILKGLDKKYLFPEVVEEADFNVGEKVNEILKDLSRDMHENINHYKYIQEEYREYIETWVHEIKTPIASAKLLAENNNNEVTKKIDIQIDRIDSFVEQVLYYSRSDEVGNDYIIKEASLGDIVKSAVKKNYREFISKKIILKLEDINETVYCDVKWIVFILNQIIGNAIKYSKVQDSIIRIYSVKNENSTTLIIEDNGVGIIERDIGRVFDKGFTGDNGRKFGKSTGMGLYICKKLCKRLGLGLNLESQLDKGTKVSIHFPVSNMTT
ncbi:sensor histidine kinase [Clostridium polynesiense]|uniref:sensor histidine kinase n=1 Tax=Clostridium polynesiense TaxID=1325933 RepID=UPI0005912288|nr:sensor histidine kinase [Clostridium polynesiense]